MSGIIGVIAVGVVAVLVSYWQVGGMY